MLFQVLRKYDCMKYTTIVAATASESAPLQFLAPYCGVFLAAVGMNMLAIESRIVMIVLKFQALLMRIRYALYVLCVGSVIFELSCSHTPARAIL